MSKILRQSVEGTEFTMAGCALTGVCASSASDYVKVITLSDGDELSDGMMTVVTFANGNTAGNAPGVQTIYSSDQIHYYSDSEMTVAFTLAPQGCYDLVYSGSGNAYSYTSYPVITVGGITAPICDSCGKKTSGALWDAGDSVVVLFTSGKFMLLSVKTSDTITDGSMRPPTSNAVYKEIAVKYDTTITDCNNMYQMGKTLCYYAPSAIANVPNSNNAWYILSQCNPSSVTGNAYITQFAKTVTTSSNEVYTRHKYLSGATMVWTPWLKLITSDEFQDKNCVHSIAVTYQQPRTIDFGNWGYGICMGNIGGAGNFCFSFAKSGLSTVAINNYQLGSAFQNAVLNGNVITVGTQSYGFTMTVNDNKTITFAWAGVNADAYLARIAFIGMSAA